MEFDGCCCKQEFQITNYLLVCSATLVPDPPFSSKTRVCNSTFNNVIEGEHGRLKRILGPKGAFKNRTSAYRTLKGMEAMHSLRKGQGDDVCLRATEPGRCDRQPGLRDGLSTPEQGQLMS